MKEVFDLTDKRKELIISGKVNYLLKIKYIRKIGRWIFKKTLAKNYKIRTGYEIDIETTTFYVPRASSFGIYMNLKNVPNKDIINELQKELTDLEDDTNEKIFNKVYLTGFYENNKPIIMFLPNKKYFISPKISSNIFSTETVNFHDLNGIFLVYG
ncbi:hypothetical protein AciM339_0802 [Aciduliprofundum sp. MAR08-339]|uniref:hypothetical protein n=1 Tax=Aciduliprofundum sp. (strain MAR08-339) TaxID=673860 RepID=UPI0002A4CAE6|nr:hypothetical protein AciM339_0802 [Aciduliprofundum sp. MAR08-339]